MKAKRLNPDIKIIPCDDGWYYLEGPLLSHYKLGDFEIYLKDGESVFVHIKNKQIHNDHGPAIKYSKDNLGFLAKYVINGKLHRDDGPALVRYDQDFMEEDEQFIPPASPIKMAIYYKNGIIHRLDGPANWNQLKDTNHKYSYFYEGKEYLKRDWIIIPEVMKTIRKKNIREKINKEFGNE